MCLVVVAVAAVGVEAVVVVIVEEAGAEAVVGVAVCV